MEKTKHCRYPTPYTTVSAASAYLRRLPPKYALIAVQALRLGQLQLPPLVLGSLRLPHLGTEIRFTTPPSPPATSSVSTYVRIFLRPSSCNPLHILFVTAQACPSYICQATRRSGACSQVRKPNPTRPSAKESCVNALILHKERLNTVGGMHSTPPFGMRGTRPQKCPARKPLEGHLHFWTRGGSCTCWQT